MMEGKGRSAGGAVGKKNKLDNDTTRHERKKIKQIWYEKQHEQKAKVEGHKIP